MTGVLSASLTAVLLALSLAATHARANPHVWIEAGMTFGLREHRVTGLTFAWRFDDYYSSHTIRTYDVDGDGSFAPVETRALRTDTFDPLARFDYHVHVWVDGERRKGHEIDRFAARIEERRLVIEFSVPVSPPADPSKGPMTVSLFDDRHEVDIRLAKSRFLLVDGEVEAGCKFRVARGRGEQSDHPQPVTLKCGG